MLKELFLVGAGSCLGGMGRYLLSLALRGVSGGFPWGTCAANLAGCLLIGVLGGLLARSEPSALQLLLMVGFCGGFTTFSTFSRESVALLQSGQLSALAGYVVLSVVGGMALTAAGYCIAKAL